MFPKLVENWSVAIWHELLDLKAPCSVLFCSGTTNAMNNCATEIEEQRAENVIEIILLPWP